MRVLVLQQPGSVAPFEHWLLEARPGIQVRILTGAGTRRPDDSIAPGVPREVLADYLSDRATARILEVCGQWRPDVLFSNAEDDVLRAAEARSLFGIPGMTADAAVAFRDKVLMKQLFEGVRVAGTAVRPVPHRVPSSSADVLAAAAEPGAVVLKPRDGAGAVGVHVLPTPDAAHDLLRSSPALLGELHRSRLILEPYVTGRTYHVDILVRDGAPIMISPSEYLVPPHRFRERNIGSVMTDAGSGPHRFLVAYAEQLTAAIAARTRPDILHLEVFRTDAGEYLAGEIACRGGGGLIKESLRHTYGVDQAWAACLLGAGLLPDATFRTRIRPQAGWLLETADLFRMPPDAVPPWVTLLRTGHRPADPTFSGDAGTQVVIEGASQDEIVGRMAQLQSAAPDLP